MYLRGGGEGDDKGHADDGVEVYYDNDEQDKHYRGSDWEADEAGVEMVMVDVMKLYWLGCLKYGFVPEFHHRIHWTRTRTRERASPEN